MDAYHNSRELKFRSPFGAVLAGQEIDLSIDIWGGELSAAVLRIWVEGDGETRIPMTIQNREGGQVASVKYKPVSKALNWYRFELTDGEANTVYYGPQKGRMGGSGRTYANEFDCPSYQITVSEERKVPDWYKNGLVYQIFPDRFARGTQVDEKELASRISGHPTGPDRRLVSWDKPVAYEKKKDGSIAAWDFYGGTLNGIREKLPYLQGLGVTVLYLNPIFEAASNHRYDTGNYNMIDPLLGTEEDFAALCKEADARGISIILDGVFNHTGCDSIYFNKYGNYDSEGAYQSEGSKYREWYSFNPEVSDGYDSWWGVGDLPNIVETNEEYQNFIYGDKDSVVRKWMRLGAKGWRLDVADELPDFFIAGIKKAMLEENPDGALLMGEVWEDASNKESYGEKRKYFQGEELDCVMNYPFRDVLCRFLTDKCDAEEFCETMYTLLENYPKEAFYSNLNLIDSHDRMRIFSILGGAPDPEKMTEKEKTEFRLSEKQKGSAKGKLWLASLIQMTMPGVPCIYYGDEVGMEGYADPYNRGAYPWDGGDKDCTTIYNNVIGIRRSHKAFTEGDFKPYAFGKDVIAYSRSLGDETMMVLVNRSEKEAHEFKIPKFGEFAADIVSGKKFDTSADEVTVKMNPLSSYIIYFAPKQRLGKIFESGTGVLCHITSIPNHGKPGVIGPETFKFLDLLKRNGEKYWQILPLNPTDFGGSPYAGSSAFAGNLDLIPFTKKEMDVRYQEYHKKKDPILPAEQLRDKKITNRFEKFVAKNAAWIDGYAMYSALKEKYKNASWRTWDAAYSTYSEELWNDKKLAAVADLYRYYQYEFDLSWNEVRAYAKSLGIQIIGDIPLYVAEDSADAWQYTEQFTIKLDPNSKEEELGAGVPPDYFSKDGQNWGNPLYRWDVMKADGYSWWMKRLERAFNLYDIVRLDHFRGFEAYWAIPKGQKASAGTWRPGPGRDLFEAAFRKFGPLPVIAEDLGFVTPGVRSLIITTGFPGMDIMQFYDGDPRFGYLPDTDRIAYTGTHDNETLLGWVRNRYKDEIENSANDIARGINPVKTNAAAGKKYAVDERESTEEDTFSVQKLMQEIYEDAFMHTHASELTAEDREDFAKQISSTAFKMTSEELLKAFYKCQAFIRIVPLQDLLGLGNSARMNTPGTIEGNWKWQAKAPMHWNIRA